MDSLYIQILTDTKKYSSYEIEEIKEIPTSCFNLFTEQLLCQKTQSNWKL